MLINTMNFPKIFSNKSLFRQNFEHGLAELLTRGGLGEFILVCANASIEPVLQAHLEEGIGLRFKEYERRFSDHPEDMIDSAMDDDVAVFLQLEALGINGLEQGRTRSEGVWELQFNQLRSFRPTRNATKIMTSLRSDFDPQGFHFNRTFLGKEIFWAGELMGRKIDLFYNKFPFAKLHGLLVPDRDRCLPQCLLKEYHDYIWQLAETVGESMPGTGFGYNATSAFSSVNHFHVQMFVREEPLPVALDIWQHNGGTEEYPARCEVFTTPVSAWEFIQQLHVDNIAYNLLYLPGRLFCFPRKMQGSYQHADWTSGFTWYELAGEMLVSQLEQYEELNVKDIEEEFAKLRLENA